MGYRGKVVTMSQLIRPSQLNSYLQCSAKYRFQYIDKVQTPKALALAFGSAVHKAFETNFKQKVDSRSDLPTEEVVQAFSDSFDQEKEEVEKRELLEDPSAKDVGVGLVKKYHEEFAPSLQPKAVEVKVEASFKNYDYGVTGTIDNLTEDKKLVDYKSARRNESTVPMSHQRQGSLYVLMAKAVNEDVDELRFDYLIKVKTPQIVSKTFVPDPMHALTMLQRVGEAIDKGIFLPNREHNFCSKRFCAYWRECTKVYGGSVKD